MKRFLLISSLSLLLLSCDKTSELDMGYNYFPVEEGRYARYEVMEVFHDVNVFPQHDTVYYLLETEIGESFIDLTENEVNYYYRSRYDNSTSELIDKRAWTIFKNHERVEVVEENQRKTKMVFAVRNHTT